MSVSQADLNLLLDNTKARAKQEQTRFTDGNHYREHSYAAQIAASNIPAVRQTAKICALLPDNKSDPFFAQRLVKDCLAGHENYLEWYNRAKKHFDHSPGFRDLLASNGVHAL